MKRGNAFHFFSIKTETFIWISDCKSSETPLCRGVEINDWRRWKCGCRRRRWRRRSCWRRSSSSSSSSSSSRDLLHISMIWSSVGQVTQIPKPRNSPAKESSKNRRESEMIPSSTQCADTFNGNEFQFFKLKKSVAFSKWSELNYLATEGWWLVKKKKSVKFAMNYTDWIDWCRKRHVFSFTRVICIFQCCCNSLISTFILVYVYTLQDLKVPPSIGLRELNLLKWMFRWIL